MNHGKSLVVRSVNISREKGTTKTPVHECYLTEDGFAGDAHSGQWHRQVSIMAVESIRDFKHQAGREILFGEFAENIALEGINLTQVQVFDRFKGDQIELEVTQIGKTCHGDTCAIFREVGKCAMPEEGIFCRVIRPGEVKEGDKLDYIPFNIKATVITLSDRAYSGVYYDNSGEQIAAELKRHFEKLQKRLEITRYVIPDDADRLTELLNQSKEDEVDVVFTTGSTGIGSRDIAPETIRSFFDKELPGIMEMIRVKYGWKNPLALLSRSVSGVSGKMLLYALPGSTKAVSEYLEVILPTLLHSIKMMHDLDHHAS